MYFFCSSYVTFFSVRRKLVRSRPPADPADVCYGEPFGVFIFFVHSRKKFKVDCQLILVPKATQDSKDYGEIKLASDTVLGIPSQVCFTMFVFFFLVPRAFFSLVRACWWWC